MKNKLLITTALVAFVSASNALAAEKVISNDITNLSNDEPTRSGALLVDYGDKITISDNVNITDNTSTIGAAGGIKALNGFTAGNNLNVSNNKSEKKMGGGMYIRLADDTHYTEENKATATNRNVVIGDNATISNNSSKWLGGGMAIESAEKVTIGNGATFEGNHSDAEGGAIAIWSDASNKLNGKEFANKTLLELGQSRFIKNTSGSTGGAIANINENTVNIAAGSLFDGNKAQKGGAIYNEGTLNIGANTVFSNNTSTGNGGAIYMFGDNSPVLTIEDGVVFSNNHADGQGGALAVSAHNQDIKIGKVLFKKNSAVDGGAIVHQLIKGKNTSKLSLDGTQFVSNKAVNGEGGAISNFSTLSVKNALFDANEATGNVANGQEDGGGALLLGTSSKTDVSNTIFKNNKATGTIGGAIATRRHYLNTNVDSGWKVANSEFISNMAQDGGAIYNTFTHDAAIESSIFTDNTSTANGGAIFNDTSAKLALSGNNIFSGNMANGALNDIHNLGNIDASGSLTLDGGISGDGTLTLAKDTNLNVKTGTTTISNKVVNNGANLGLTFDNGFTGKYELITNGGTLDNEFNIAENGIYNIETDDQNKGTYNISKKNTGEISASTGASSNQANTVNAVTNGKSDNIQFNLIANNISDLMQSTNKSDVQTGLNAVTALAPETAAMVQSASTENANQVFGAVGSRLSGGSISSSSEGMASGDSVFDRGAMWVQGLFNKTKLDDTSKAKGFDADSNGVALGAEKQIDRSTKAGVGYAYTNTDIDGFMRKTDVDTHTAILYGEYKPSNWFVNGIATYGWSDYSEKKNVAGSQVKADYDVNAFGLQAMTGYDLFYKNVKFTPEAGLRYVNIKQDSYRDSVDQRVGSNSSDILTGVIGAKVKQNFVLNSGMNLRPEARLAMTYDLTNDDANSIVSLANGSAYQVKGEALDRFGVEVGAGLTADINDRVELSVGYEGKFRQDYQDHTGLLNAKYKF